jgi:DNA-binding CsgD family transcriptional regulator
MKMKTVQKLSQYLLRLSQGALEKPAYEFQDWALSETKSLIPFDSCAWGKGSWISDTPAIHTVHLHKLDETFVESWLRFQHEDKLTREVTQNSNRTFNVALARDYANTDIYNIHCKKFCLEHVISTGSIDPDTQIINSIIMYRSDVNKPFTEEERALKEILFQHLIEAARVNWLTNLPNMFSAYQRSSFSALAASDNSGLLHIAMPSFVEICREEWPTWKGPFLPKPVLEAMQNKNSYIGQSIVVSNFQINEITLLRARAKAPADHLGARELEIAQQIADGKDYKTIAIDMGISPATVKTHTINIYAKLGINDKARIAVELGKMCH